jgi:hypothetical protein
MTSLEDRLKALADVRIHAYNLHQTLLSYRPDLTHLCQMKLKVDQLSSNGAQSDPVIVPTL